MIKRLFPYYGAKHLYAKNYPAPRHGHIVEPFAGSAGYSHFWGDKNNVTLVEKNPRIAAIWRWLTSVSEDEFMSLPGVDTFNHIDETNLSEGPGREFVRQWCSISAPRGANTVSPLIKDQVAQRLYSFGTEHKSIVWQNVRKVRHWKVIEGDYSNAPDAYATWFIDPPYQVGGDYYLRDCKAKYLDFAALADWSRARMGDVIVCEGDGATWLDFDELRRAKKPRSRGNKAADGFGEKNRRRELIWYSRDGVRVSQQGIRLHTQMWKVKK